MRSVRTPKRCRKCLKGCVTVEPHDEPLEYGGFVGFYASCLNCGAPWSETPAGADKKIGPYISVLEMILLKMAPVSRIREFRGSAVTGLWERHDLP